MDITLENNPLFPISTTVKAYLASGWGPDTPVSGKPIGSVVKEAAVAEDGKLALKGLAADTKYFLAAEVGGVWRYSALLTSEAEVEPASQAEVSVLEEQLAAKLNKPESIPGYTQTFSTAARTHAEAELPTNISATLVSEVDTQLNATNKALNELKKLANGIVDDLQAAGLAK